MVGRRDFFCASVYVITVLATISSNQDDKDVGFFAVLNSWMMQISLIWNLLMRLRGFKAADTDSIESVSESSFKSMRRNISGLIKATDSIESVSDFSNVEIETVDSRIFDEEDKESSIEIDFDGLESEMKELREKIDDLNSIVLDEKDEQELKAKFPPVSVSSIESMSIPDEDSISSVEIETKEIDDLKSLEGAIVLDEKEQQELKAKFSPVEEHLRKISLT